MSIYDNIILDMINKRLNLDKTLNFLFNLAISCQFRKDLYAIFMITSHIEDSNLAQDFLQIIYNGTYQFYDYFHKLDKYHIKNNWIINKYINNLVKDENEIDKINYKFREIYNSCIVGLFIDCNMMIVL
jgi:hypothetical protein